MITELLFILPLALVVLCAIVAVLTKDLMLSVISLGVLSLIISVVFYFLHAPDVAISEAAIGAGLTTAVFIIAINKTTRWEE